MFIFLFSVSFLALIVFILLSVLGFIKKNGQGKKNLKIAGICFLVSFCSLIVEAIVNPVPMEINLKVTSEIPKRVESTQKSITIKGQVEYADQLEVNGKSVKIEDNTFQ